LIRSPWKRTNKLDGNRIIYGGKDESKSYTTGASFHLINRSSVDELRQRVKDKYPEGLANFMVECEQFRPNIIIDTKESFSEDLFTEMRVGSCLFRNVGPAVRCNAIRVNYDKHCRVDEGEPYSTLSSFRKIPELGIVFGMFYQ